MNLDAAQVHQVAILRMSTVIPKYFRRLPRLTVQTTPEYLVFVISRCTNLIYVTTWSSSTLSSSYFNYGETPDKCKNSVFEEFGR